MSQYLRDGGLSYKKGIRHREANEEEDELNPEVFAERLLEESLELSEGVNKSH